jgi:hypothetical protein
MRKEMKTLSSMYEWHKEQYDEWAQRYIPYTEADKSKRFKMCLLHRRAMRQYKPVELMTVRELALEARRSVTPVSAPWFGQGRNRNQQLVNRLCDLVLEKA